MLKTSRIIHHEVTLGGKTRPILLPSEKILLRTRQHWIILIMPVFFSIIIAIVVSSFPYYLFILKISQIGLFISSALVIILITGSVIATIKEVRKDQTC